MNKKIILDKKLTTIFLFWSSFIFFLGFGSGYFSPSHTEAKLKSYAILLEKENHSLNNRVKYCKNQINVLEYKCTDGKQRN